MSVIVNSLISLPLTVTYDPAKDFSSVLQYFLKDILEGLFESSIPSPFKVFPASLLELLKIQFIQSQSASQHLIVLRNQQHH